MQQTSESLQDVKPNFPSSRNKDIPLELLVMYADKGLSLGEIGQLCGCSESNVCRRLQASGYTLQRDHAWQKHAAALMRLRQSEILNSVKPSDIKAASLRDRIVALGILVDKEMDITQGRVSGPQISVVQQQAVLSGQNMAQADEEIARLEAEIAKLMPQPIDITG
jgi:AraC-like DNA-binding protein